MAGERFRRLDERVYVAPQLAADELAQARAMGVRTVVNNRPDGEAPDQPDSAEVERLARAAGLGYVHIPVEVGRLTPDAVEAFAGTLAGTSGPLLAYCRSGTRSCHLWALAAAKGGRPVDEVVDAAARAGFDLAGARPMLERVAAEAGPAQPETSQR